MCIITSLDDCIAQKREFKKKEREAKDDDLIVVNLS